MALVCHTLHVGWTARDMTLLNTALGCAHLSTRGPFARAQIRHAERVAAALKKQACKEKDDCPDAFHMKPNAALSGRWPTIHQ